MKNDHGVDAFYFHDKLGQVLRDLGSYKADELARALCRLAKVADENVLKEPEFAQQPATAVPVAVGCEPVAWAVDVQGYTRLLYTSLSAAEDSARHYGEERGLGVSIATLYAAPPAAEQPDTVAVPRELLERVTKDWYGVCKKYHWAAIAELRALLGKEGE